MLRRRFGNFRIARIISRRAPQNFRAQPLHELRICPLFQLFNHKCTILTQFCSFNGAVTAETICQTAHVPFLQFPPNERFHHFLARNASASSIPASDRRLPGLSSSPPAFKAAKFDFSRTCKAGDMVHQSLGALWPMSETSSPTLSQPKQCRSSEQGMGVGKPVHDQCLFQQAATYRFKTKPPRS